MTSGALACVLMLSTTSAAQYAERPSLAGSGQPDVDVSGRSVKNPRVRAIHSTDPTLKGTSAYFVSRDPFLAYQLGRNLNYREFRSRDGVFNTSPTGVAGFGGPMVDGTTAKITANNQASCLGCHNLPNGNPGGGTNFAKDSGLGRNAPHYYGAGIVEMLAIQNRATLINMIDTDGDGWVSAVEANAAPNPLQISTESGRSGGGIASDPFASGMMSGQKAPPTLFSGPSIQYGSAALDGGATGSPQFNSIIRVWYGLESGGVIDIAPGATSIDGVNATHYNFEIVVWGWGQRTPASALNPTNRAFLWDPWVSHSGLESYDPSSGNDPDGDGVSVPTICGAIQFPATHLAPDSGTSLDPLGFSTHDPDGDGYYTEISEGDLDLAEWFMLNTPRPAYSDTKQSYDSGTYAMQQLGCTSCHVPNWTISPQASPFGASAEFAGDRRLFDLDVTWNEETQRLEGELEPLYDVIGRDFVPNRQAFQVNGLFSDLLQHEMGEGFAEMAYDGNVNSTWRTPPLWGVGSGFPWGHDGASLTLDDAIRRHGGEAVASAEAYANAGPGMRRNLLRLLENLVLYDIESLPADINGDGMISEAYTVAGQDTGLERFNAEWLFVHPVEIQGSVLNSDGIVIRSNQAVNLSTAYGLDLESRRDSDLDGWPDVWDNAPFTAGYKDGVN
jgi:hypothetical protein